MFVPDTTGTEESVEISKICGPYILFTTKLYFQSDSIDPTQIFLTIIKVGSIDHSSRCKLDVYVRAHIKAKQINTILKICKAVKVKEWAKAEWECLLLISIYSFNSKFKVTGKNVNFDCWYIGTHTKKKPSKISNIEVTISLSSHQNTLRVLSECLILIGSAMFDACFNLVTRVGLP